MIWKYSIAIVWNFKDLSILAYLAWPKKTRTHRMSLNFNQRQMSILNSQKSSKIFEQHAQVLFLLFCFHFEILYNIFSI
jgi:hypothetical protein